MRTIAGSSLHARPQLTGLSQHVIRISQHRWLHPYAGGKRQWPSGSGSASIRRSVACSAASQIRRIHQIDPTIYALSSGAGRAAIAVIRISGNDCLGIYAALCPGKATPVPRQACVRTLYQPAKEPTQHTILDSSALLLYFPAPRSATGEDVLELHVHGGPAVVKAVLAAIASYAEAGGGNVIRYAEPGEFTRRAFLNRRLDLTQVEALGDTLNAETEQQRLLSVRGTSGVLGQLYERWRDQLLHARGELEALIDFSEDQHFDESPSTLCASVAAQVEVLRRTLRIHSRNAVRGELLRNGISLSLLGAPNAGKSSLLNRIVGREAAIVSNEAGTTRDVVEVGLDIGGYFCRIGDTAGLRTALSRAAGIRPPSPTRNLDESDALISQIEEEGMRRAKARAEESDVVIVVLSFETSSSSSSNHITDATFTATLRLDPEVHGTAARLVREKGNVIIVINKADLAPEPHVREAALQQILAAFPGVGKDAVHLISCANAASQHADPTLPGTGRDLSAKHLHVCDPPGDPTANAAATRTAAPEDPGGIQALLHGLVQHFTHLTTALTDEHGVADFQRQASVAIRENDDDDDDKGLKNVIRPFRPAAEARAGVNTTSAATLTTTTSTTTRNAGLPDSAVTSRDPSAAGGARHLASWDETLGASARHRELLDSCGRHLDAFMSSVQVGQSPRGPQRLQQQHQQHQQQQQQQQGWQSSLSIDPLCASIDHPRSFVAAANDPGPCAGADGVPAGFSVGSDDQAEPDIVVAAEHLRAAADCLARITGRGHAGDVEEVLGVVFEKFCVGK